MPVALAIGAVAAAGIGAAASHSAANKASNAATNAANSNNALQKQVYDTNAATLSPYVKAGNTATTSIQSLLGLGGNSAGADAAYDAYKGSSEYQSRLTQGQDSVTAALGGKGLLDSGAAQKSLTQFGQTFASNEFGSYLGNLRGQQEVGLGAASAQAGVGSNYASQVGANNNQAATTVGNAALSNANQVNGVLGAGVSAFGQALGSSYKPVLTGAGRGV